MSASGVLSAEARVGECASDVVVLKRQTPGVSVCCEWHQQLRKPRRRQTWCASVAFTTDASGEKSARLGAYWTAFGERRMRRIQAIDASDGVKIDRWKFECQDTWRASERQTLDAASVARATDTSGDPDQCITALFEGVRLYICVDRL
jgi:hypothetical protein